MVTFLDDIASLHASIRTDMTPPAVRARWQLSEADTAMLQQNGQAHTLLENSPNPLNHRQRADVRVFTQRRLVDAAVRHRAGKQHHARMQKEQLMERLPMAVPDAIDESKLDHQLAAMDESSTDAWLP